MPGKLSGKLTHSKIDFGICFTVFEEKDRAITTANLTIGAVNEIPKK